MSNNWLDRTTLLIGKNNVEKLKETNVLIVGLGGVGGFAAEFLARAGVGRMVLIDGDKIDATNKNRQIIALDSTIGLSKANALANRLKDINPKIDIVVQEQFLRPEMMWDLVMEPFDFVLDCIDTIQPKFQLILACKRHEIPFISAMGAGGKMDVSKVKVMNIWKTEQDPLAFKIKKLLKKQKALRKFKVVCSTEQIKEDALQHVEEADFKKTFYGTISYMPAIFGLYMAEYVIRKICTREITH